MSMQLAGSDESNGRTACRTFWLVVVPGWFHNFFLCCHFVSLRGLIRAS